MAIKPKRSWGSGEGGGFEASKKKKAVHNPGWSSAGAPLRAGKPWDPPGNFAFWVECDGLMVAQFASVDGLSIEKEVVEYSFAEDFVGRKIPGGEKYGDITLKTGWIDTTLEDWLTQDDGSRKTLAIVMTDDSGMELRRWECYECFAKSWKLGTFDAKGNDVMMEELVFATEWFEGVAP